MTTTPRPDEDAFAAFAAELIRSGAHLAMLIDHMARYAESGRSTATDPLGTILQRLFHGTLDDRLAPRYTADDARHATTFLSDALDAIAEDIYLVDPDWDPSDDDDEDRDLATERPRATPRPNRAARRARRRR